ncbi:hypothetical protein GCM10027051_24190 [Niabella terrae]
MSDKQLHNRIFDLIARKLSGSARPEELRELDAYLEQFPDFSTFHDHLLDNPIHNSEVEKDATDQAYAAQYVRMMYADKEHAAGPLDLSGAGHRPVRRIRSILLTAAAGLLLFVALWPGWYQEPADKQPSADLAQTPVSSKSKLTLPDGTIVYLNADSHLEYGNDFNIRSRHVTLTGEAFFDVAHNAKMPFIVHTDKATVKVLGTRFNIKNYSDETWEATLLQGKIEMYVNRHPASKLELEPSQKVAVIPVTAKVDSAATDFRVSVTKFTRLQTEIAETAWMEDKLVFVDKPLEEIAHELERSFGISVRFLSDKYKQQHYTGNFKKEDLERLLEILNLSNPIDYQLKDHELIIR